MLSNIVIVMCMVSSYEMGVLVIPVSSTGLN